MPCSQLDVYSAEISEYCRGRVKKKKKKANTSCVVKRVVLPLLILCESFFFGKKKLYRVAIKGETKTQWQ